ncbi:MAG: SAM-dependent methyltransferase [Ruminococcaceae bacterium]|nr:SAM-dependent methyltransferase [Oscillospiraceae bacterium]
MTERISQFLNQDIAYIVISGVRKGVESEYSKVTIKPFAAKDGLKYQLEFTKGKQVVHQNIEKDVLSENIAQLFDTFIQCVIYGAENDFHLNCFNGKIKAKTMPPSKKVKVASHNKQKEYVFNEGDDIDFLIYLGVMTKDKKVVKAKYNKFRQINKYLELLKSSIDSLPTDRPLKIVDFGCGKAYLTFALYYYVVKILGREAYITGLDLKEDVIDYCNKVARELNYNTLEFQKGDIKNYSRTQDVDMVIMLHACDNATDEGIVQSIKFNAKIIIAVPCCQHEFFPQIKNDSLNPMLSHGIIKERLSALVTDSLRAQILKAIGFEVSVMEFIETEHTPKNIAIRAVKKGGLNKKAFEEYEIFRDNFNLTPYIEQRFRQEKFL